MQPALKMKTQYTNRELFDKLVNFKTDSFVPSKEQYRHLINPVIEVCETYINYPELYEPKIHVLHSFTGSGKTTVLTNHLLYEMKKYFSGVLISAPSKDLVTKLGESINTNDFQLIELNSKTLRHYFDRDSYRKFPVFIVTQQFFAGAKNLSYFETLAQTMYEIDSTKMGLGVFVDECHRGAGNSSVDMIELNYGYSNSIWTGAIFNVLNSLIATECAVVFGYSATPTNEQQMDDSDYFKLLAVYDRVKEKSPFVDFYTLPVGKSDLRILTSVKARMFTRNALGDILKRFRERSELRYEMDLPQPKIIIKIPQRHPLSNELPINLIRKELAILARDIKWDDLIICSYTGEESFINDDYYDKNDFVKKVNEIRDNPMAILVVNGLNFGTDIPEISEVVSFIVPNQKKPDGIIRDEYVTMGIEQLYGRAMRTNVIDIPNAIKQLGNMKDEVPDTQAKQVIDMMAEYLTANIYSADSEIHEQVSEKISGETFNSKKGKEWLKSLYNEHITQHELPQIGKGRERLKKVFDQTSALKQYKQKYCQYHGEACFELSYISYAKNEKNSLSKDDYLNSELWDTQLQVDHKDGNRNNNDSSNFETLCANAHAEKTIRQGDCYNNYQLK
jgi:hypothetical protein